MTNILKPFVASATALSQDKFFLATLKLTFYYVFSTAVILFVSSVAVLFLFAPPETELPFRAEIESVEEEHYEWSAYELREHLASVVFLVDFIILLIVSAFSYYFARRTLLPIKKMHEVQTQFMGDVAHEIRTPLSVMRAGADTLLKKTRSTAEYVDFITDVQEEAQRLTRLSNQLLQLLKTENNVSKIIFKEVDLSKLSENELRRFVPYAQLHSVTLVSKVIPDISVHTNSDIYIEIIQNILKNAIDYNKYGGTVTMKLFEEANNVVLEIIDTGVGISKEGQAKIFDRFVKGDTARTQTTGSGAGLGLSIVKALLQKIGGDIVLTSTLNVGTTLTVTIHKTHS